MQLTNNQPSVDWKTQKVRRFVRRVLAGDNLRQGAQGDHRRRPRQGAMARGPAIKGCTQNCTPRCDFIGKLALSGPEGGTFERPHGEPWSQICLGARRLPGRVSTVSQNGLPLGGPLGLQKKIFTEKCRCCVLRDTKKATSHRVLFRPPRLIAIFHPK